MGDAMYRLGKAVQAGTEPSPDARAASAQLFRQLIIDFPTFAPGYRGLGIVEGTRGQWLAAYVAYKHYIQLDLSAAEKENVRAELAKLAQQDPVLGLYANGEQAAFNNEWTRVIIVMGEVVAERPSFSLAYRLLGIAYAAQGKAKHSVDAYRTYLSLDKLAPDQKEVAQIITDINYALERKTRRVREGSDATRR